MNDLERRLERTLGKLDALSMPDRLEGIRSRAGRRRRLLLAASLFVLVALAGTSWLVIDSVETKRADPIQPAPESSESTSADEGRCRDQTPPPLAKASDDFLPPGARTESGRTVLPIYFPDGSTAELVYPSRLELERLHVQADLVGDVPGGSQVRPVISYGGIPFPVLPEPDGCIDAAGGTQMPVWVQKNGEETIVFRAGDWYVAVTDFTRLEVWAQQLRIELRNGWLVLKGGPDLKLGPELDPGDSNLVFQSRRNLMTVWPLRCPNDSGPGDRGVDSLGREGFASFCVDDVEIHAQGRPGFVTEALEGLRPRNLRTRLPLDHYTILP